MLFPEQVSEETWNSLLLDDTALIVTLAVPLLVRITRWDWLVVPTVNEPKSREVLSSVYPTV